ncbi:hypothetical protein ACLB2K_041114 [Fragaria x ananassa]
MKNSGDLKLAHEHPISQLQAVEVDRISALPDEILCHILSILIPLYSVRTTVLSKRWNNLWTGCITNLDFNMYDFRSSWSNYRVLALRDSSKDITRFRVAWACCEDFSIIDRWIQVAVKADVVELDVEFCVECCDGPSYVYPFEMPRCVYTCKSLVSLKVKTDYLTYYSLPQTGCCFPNLKFLHYISGYDSDRASRENLFCSCPVLEELTIEAHHKKRVLNFNISAPELRTLTTIITQEGYEEYECDSDSEEESCWKWLAEVLNISPNLESLVLEFAKIGGDSFQPPEFVPSCLSSQLKTISIKGFKGTPNEINVAKYLLSYGEVLHKVIVSSPSCFCIGDAEEKILSFEKGSKICQVEFMEEVDSELSSEKGSETIEDYDSESD